MSNKLHGNVETRVIDAFHAVDLGAPFQVVLMDCVTGEFDAETGEMLSYTIPDFEGLVRHVVMARLVHDRKLSGAELQFLRKAVGVAQVELARVLDCKPEHLSRVEKGKHPLTTMPEQWARMFLFERAAKLHNMEESDFKTRMMDLLNKMFAGLKPVAAFDAAELIFSFHRVDEEKSLAANDDWIEGPPIAQLGNWSDGVDAVARYA